MKIQTENFFGILISMRLLFTVYRGGFRGAHPARAPPKIGKKYDFLA
jgi:hypothetical protein